MPMVDIEATPDETKKITGANVKSQVLAGHKDLTTGVHGVGAGTVAKVGDIAVDANLSAAGQDAITKRHTQNTDSDLSPAHKNATTGVHGAGSSYIALAPAASHLVRTFTKGWTVDKFLKGAGVDADPAEVDTPGDRKSVV